MHQDKVVISTLRMPPWESFQGRETGEWKRAFCFFHRTPDRPGEATLFLFCFGLAQNIFFACPLDSCTMGIMLQVILGMFQFLLLTRIPTSQAKVCMRLTPSDHTFEAVSLPSDVCFCGLFRVNIDVQSLGLSQVLFEVTWSGGEHAGLRGSLPPRSMTPVT